MQAIEVVWLLSNPDHQEHKSAPIEILLALNRRSKIIWLLMMSLIKKRCLKEIRRMNKRRRFMRIRMMMMMRMRMRLKMTTRCDYRDASQGSPSCDDLPAYPQASLDYHQYQSATSPLSSSPWELYSRCGRWEEQSLQQAEAMQAAGDNLVDLCKYVLTNLVNIINLKLSSYSNCHCHQPQTVNIFKF